MNILITGGSSDIAQAIVKRRLAIGDRLIITASSEQSLKKTLALYGSSSDRITGFVFHFSQPENSLLTIKNLLTEPIDAVILNAFGRLTRFRKLHELPIESIQEYITTNVHGNIWLIHRLLPAMLDNHFGRLVLISSVSTVTGTSLYGSYCAAKAALEGLFLNLAVDYSAQNILANIVRAGLCKTQRTKKFWSRAGYQEKMARIIPQAVMGEPEQIAEALDPLLSPTSYMSGSVVTVSGGLPLICSGGLSS